jgi:hypothetical protein
LTLDSQLANVILMPTTPMTMTMKRTALMKRRTGGRRPA